MIYFPQSNAEATDHASQAAESYAVMAAVCFSLLLFTIHQLDIFSLFAHFELVVASGTVWIHRQICGKNYSCFQFVFRIKVRIRTTSKSSQNLHFCIWNCEITRKFEVQMVFYAFICFFFFLFFSFFADADTAAFLRRTDNVSEKVEKSSSCWWLLEWSIPRNWKGINQKRILLKLYEIT